MRIDYRWIKTDVSVPVVQLLDLQSVAGMKLL